MVNNLAIYKGRRHILNGRYDENTMNSNPQSERLLNK